jgi:parallel beta-helix repeat protein
MSENIISSNNKDGIVFYASSPLKSKNNTITYNVIESNNRSIYLENSSKNLIIKNNLLNNKRDAFFSNCNNKWNQNYWNRPRIFPKLIFGMKKYGPIWLPCLPDIDWRPALKPYDI